MLSLRLITGRDGRQKILSRLKVLEHPSCSSPSKKFVNRLQKVATTSTQFEHSLSTFGNNFRNVVRMSSVRRGYKEQFLLFSLLFYIYISNFRSQITYSFVKCGCSIYCFFSLSQLWYVEVRISRSVSLSPLEFEITRVDCIYYPTYLRLL